MAGPDDAVRKEEAEALEARIARDTAQDTAIGAATQKATDAVASASQASSAALTAAGKADAAATTAGSFGARLTAVEAQIAGTAPTVPAQPSSGVKIGGLIFLNDYIDSAPAASTDDVAWAKATAAAAAMRVKPLIVVGRADRKVLVTKPQVVYPGFRYGTLTLGSEQVRSNDPTPSEMKIDVPVTTANPSGAWLHYPASNPFGTGCEGVSHELGAATLYAMTEPGAVCWRALFVNISATNGMGMFGNTKNKFLATASSFFEGHGNINNMRDTMLNIGGSDCSLFLGGRTYVDSPPSFMKGDYHCWFSALSKSEVGAFYMTAESCGGVRVTGGASTFGLRFNGSLVEGRHADQPSRLPLWSHEGGRAKYRDVANNYAAAEMFRVSGGQASILGCGGERAVGVAESVPMVLVTGSGQARIRDAEGWGSGWTQKPLAKGPAAQINADDSVRVAA